MEDADIVARWGGDEFAILLRGAPGMTCASLPRIAERIIKEINRPFQIDGYEIVVGASVGVALLHRDGLTIETLLSNADLALYAAKSEGRNRWRSYERQLGLHAQSRRTLEIDLRAAIANEGLIIACRYLLPADQQRRDPRDLRRLRGGMARWVIIRRAAGFRQPNSFRSPRNSG